ncbi:hypothetical protein J2S00_001183 [Caldalkalibacillus uzonensis]|uniref:Transposase n=1 Tax=Caldalkalibacillus uzonensis TaxID=353224 RepID=A0ABU0CPU4_9BACI|nr:hypothetical protein [Caldalkalibacillus uzonensis]MDQ0338399.1 hypothetical protein [Caldalkalibacillus uzonensis]
MEIEDIETLVVNARNMKNVCERKTDAKDAEVLLICCGMACYR